MRATVHFDVKLEGKEFSIDAIDGQALPLVTDVGAKQATDTFKYHLNPADNISVKLRFTPSLRHRNGKIVEDIKPAGGIRISFSNGDSQDLGLEAVLHHPELQLSAPVGGVLDFGTLHVECERTLLCTVTNVSHCDAAVSFSHVKKVFQASSLSKGDEEDEIEAASEVLQPLWHPSISSHTLANRLKFLTIRTASHSSPRRPYYEGGAGKLWFPAN
jgi:hypothetical protein